MSQISKNVPGRFDTLPINNIYMICTRLFFYFSVVCLAIMGCTTPATGAMGQGGQAAKVNGSDPSYVRGMTSGRARSLGGAAVAVLSLVASLRARRKSAANTSNWRSWSMISLALGVAAVVLSVVHLANTNGDFGTGGGKAGAIVALVIGFIGITLSTLTFVQRKNGK